MAAQGALVKVYLVGGTSLHWLTGKLAYSYNGEGAVILDRRRKEVIIPATQVHYVEVQDG